MNEKFSAALAGAIKRPLLADFHTHTAYCDGKHSPEEMVQAAIEKGLTTLGICTHSPMPFYESYTIAEGEIAAFQAEINALKQKYGNKIALFCGMEKDVYSQTPIAGFDYVIGSAHYLKKDNDYCAVDLSPTAFQAGVLRLFGGDYYAAAENYYEALAPAVQKTDADIIGHFDLITKFNEGGSLFDVTHPRYVAAWKKAADALLATGKVFEINTGAISRGWRTAPYPATEIVDYLQKNGAKLIASSDSHSKENIAYAYALTEQYFLKP